MAIPSLERAALWYRKAADQGFAQAQFHLAGLYARGKGVPQDFILARDLYLKAALQGDAEAQHNLGNMYARGDGVEKDYAEAVSWWLKAAENGHAVAQSKMAQAHLNLAMNGGRDRIDVIRAHVWASLAAGTACREVAGLTESADDTSDTDAKRSVCLVAPSYSGAAEVMMTPAELAQARMLVRDWRPGKSLGVPPSPDALRKLPEDNKAFQMMLRENKIPPRPPKPTGPDTPGVFVITPVRP